MIKTFIQFRSSLKNHTRFQTKMAKFIPVFRPKRRKNPTRWGVTYLYSLYKGVPPPPGQKMRNIFWYLVLQNCLYILGNFFRGTSQKGKPESVPRMDKMPKWILACAANSFAWVRSLWPARVNFNNSFQPRRHAYTFNFLTLTFLLDFPLS